MKTLPFGLKVVAAFFLGEGIERALVTLAGLPDSAEASILARSGVHLAACWLIAALIVLRVPAGRYCSMAYFMVSLTWTSAALSFVHPELWVGLSTPRRVFVLAGCLLDGLFLYYLLGPRGRVPPAEV